MNVRDDLIVKEPEKPNKLTYISDTPGSNAVKINSPMLVSAITCLIAAIGFLLPWGMAYYEAETTTQTITLYGTPITVEISYKDFWASITGIGSGGCKMEGVLTMMALSGDYEAELEFAHDLGVIGIAGFSLNIVAFVLLLLASLGLPISPTGMRCLGYSGLVVLVVGLSLGLAYLGILYAGLGKLETDVDVKITMSTYPPLRFEGEEELDLKDLVKEADGFYPGYGLILAFIMWMISLACFVRGMRSMAIARPVSPSAHDASEAIMSA